MENLISAFQKTRVLPVLRSNDVKACTELIDIYHGCGIRVVEVLAPSRKNAFYMFSALVRHVQKFESFFIGVKCNSKSYALPYLKHGASYVSSPFLDPEIAQACSDFSVPWIPGCVAMEDVNKATDMGARIISVLPGIGKPGRVGLISQIVKNVNFITSIANPLSPVEMVEWADAGALAVRIEAPPFLALENRESSRSGFRNMVENQVGPLVKHFTDNQTTANTNVNC